MLKSMFGDNVITINPATRSRCISESIAVILTIREQKNLNIIYSEAKNLADKLAREYNIQSGGDMSDIKKICE